LCGVRADGGVADCHAEAGLEGCYLSAREVVDCLAAVGGTVSEWVGECVHALEGPVPCSEVEHGGPVVGEVFCWDAARAARDVGQIRAQGGVQCVSSDELMEMR